MPSVTIDATQERILRKLHRTETTIRLGDLLGKSPTWVTLALKLLNLETAQQRSRRLKRLFRKLGD